MLEEAKVKFNISTVKDIVRPEIQMLAEEIDRVNKLDLTINMLENVLSVLDNPNRKEKYEHLIFLEYAIPLIYGVGADASKRIFDSLSHSLYYGVCYEANPSKYYEADLRKHDNVVKRFYNQVKIKYDEKVTERALFDLRDLKIRHKTYCTIMEYFQNSKALNDGQYNALKKLLNSKELDHKTTLTLYAVIDAHNVRCSRLSKGKSYNPGFGKRFITMLQTDREVVEEPWIDSIRKNQLDCLAENITKFYTGVNTDGLADMLPYYDANLIFSDAYTLDEFSYLINLLLYHYQDRMVFAIAELYSNYDNIEYRNMLAQEHYNASKVFDYIIAYRDSQFKKYADELAKEMEVKPDVNYLSYATASGLDATTYFESDIKDMPQDLYIRIMELIIQFKKGEISNKVKALNGIRHGLMEIKDDQIRIVGEKRKENEYVILGCMLKKEDVAARQYYKLSQRNIGALVAGNDIECKIFKKLVDEQHHGGRLNA